MLTRIVGNIRIKTKELLLSRHLLSNKKSYYLADLYDVNNHDDDDLNVNFSAKEEPSLLSKEVYVTF